VPLIWRRATGLESSVYADDEEELRVGRIRPLGGGAVKVAAATSSGSWSPSHTMRSRLRDRLACGLPLGGIGR